MRLKKNTRIVALSLTLALCALVAPGIAMAGGSKHKSAACGPYKLVVHYNGNSSTGDRTHIHSIVGPVGIEWNPVSASVEICSVTGVETNGKHWRVLGRSVGHHSFAHGAKLKSATIIARPKKS